MCTYGWPAFLKSLPGRSRAHQVPKSNKLLNFNSTEPSWRTQTDATYEMARTLEVPKSLTPKSDRKSVV